MPSFLAILCALSLVVGQAFYGGLMRPVFALPTYFLIGLAALLAVTKFRAVSEGKANIGSLAIVSVFGLWMCWRELSAADAWSAGIFLRLTLGCLAAYFLFAISIVSSTARLVFLVIFLLACCLQAILGLWQSLNEHAGFPLPWFSIQFQLWYAPRFGERAHGFYLNGNHLSWLLNSGFLFSLAFALWGRAKWPWSATSVVVALLCLAGTLSTASRGGILSLVLGTIVLSLISLMGVAMMAKTLSIRRSASTAAVILSVSAVAYAIVSNSAAVQSRMNLGLSDSYRQAIFDVGLRQIQISPLIGTGPGSFAIFARQYKTVLEGADDLFAHNDCVQIAGDFGMAAVCLLVLVLVWHLGISVGSIGWIFKARVAHSVRRQSTALALQVGALASIIAFACHSWTDFNMQIPVNALLAAICLGILANNGIPRSSDQRWSWGAGGRVLAPALCGIALLCLSSFVATPEYRWLQAENALLKGNWRAAKLIIMEDRKAPTHPKLLRVLGETLAIEARNQSSVSERAQLFQQSTEAFGRALKLDPRNSTLQFFMADSLLELGEANGAQIAALRGLAASPKRAIGWELYSENLLRHGRFEEAKLGFILATTLTGATAWPLKQKYIEQKLRETNERQ